MFITLTLSNGTEVTIRTRTIAYFTPQGSGAKIVLSGNSENLIVKESVAKILTITKESY